VLILGDRAHAWPEIHIAGVGWVPFDIYPEQSDEPPPRFVDQSLESLLGELARDDPTGGRAADPDSQLSIPWARLGQALGGAALIVLLGGYTVKAGRIAVAAARPAAHQLRFAATLDRFSDLGLGRQRGETRERHAERLAPLAPSLVPLTRVHLRLTLGRPAVDDVDAVRTLARQTLSEYGTRIPRWKRALGWLNPLGWWFTR